MNSAAAIPNLASIPAIELPDRGPTWCLYHANCMDGFTAAWAIWKRWPRTDFIPASYGSPLPFTDTERKHLRFRPSILMVDFSFSAEAMREMATWADVTVLDHHKTAQADLQPLLDDGTVAGVFDMSKSGARLAWEYAHPGVDVPPLVQHVEDRDLWRFELEDTREIHAYLSSLKPSFPSWSTVDHMICSYDDAPRVVYAGEAITEKQERDLEAVLEANQGRFARIGGVTVPIANCPYWLASELGNKLSIGHPFSATYQDSANGRGWSLRSQADGADVSAVAKLFGGGGHARAAGFRSEITWIGEPEPVVMVAPSAAVLIRVLKAMPNPEHVDLHTYEAQQIAVSGCIQAMAKIKAITGQQMRDAIDAAAGWAARWQGARARGYEAEKATFMSIFMDRRCSTGWGQIAKLYEKLTGEKVPC